MVHWATIVIGACSITLLAGCGASPHGPVAPLPREVVEAPISRGDAVVVRPAAILDARGGVYLAICAEGPSEKAAWTAKALAAGMFSPSMPDVQNISLSDVRGPVELRGPRHEDPPWPIGHVHYGDPVQMVFSDGERARFAWCIPLRCREPEGPVRASISAEAASAVLPRAENDRIYWMSKEGMQQLNRPASFPLEVEEATLRLTPRPAYRIRSVQSFYDH
jgi:hypothetical protein